MKTLNCALCSNAITRAREAGVKLSHSIDALVKLEVEAGYKDGIVSYDQ